MVKIDLNNYLYTEFKDKGRNKKIDKSIFLVKADASVQQGHVYYRNYILIDSRKIYMPKYYLSKRIRLKIELVDE